MPNYTYQCENCDYEELRNYSISGSPKVVTCPECGMHALIRCIGRGSMVKMDGPKFFKDGGHSSNCRL